MTKFIVATIIFAYVMANTPPGVMGHPAGIGQPDETNPCAEGECVPYYQCANGQVVTDGEGLIDLRSVEDVGEKYNASENVNHNISPCKGFLNTCCILRSESPIDLNKDNKSQFGQVFDKLISGNNSCGHRNVDGVGFQITGGKDNEAKFGEFPWIVAILKEEKIFEEKFNLYQCGGSLISPGVVLTAANCVSGKVLSSLKVRAGDWDTQTRDEIFPHQDRYVSEIVIHEEYSKAGLFNDIALLFLDKPFEIAENVNTICLPPQDYVFDGSRCFASGWGKDTFGLTGKYQPILKRVELPIIPREPCVHALRGTRLGPHFELNKSFICAGGEVGKDTCKGDGGSPLVCPVPGEVNRYYQAGIVAWGIGCGDSTPGVYVNVPLFRNWIDSKMLHKNYDQTSYIL